MKKLTISLMALSFSLVAGANELYLPDYNYTISDVLEKGVTKEELFSKMNRDFIKLGDSICANRAHMWSFDYKRSYDIDAAKIFLFYTKKNGSTGDTNWWYHVAPIVGENGKMFVMDAGFTSSIKGPITKEQWLKRFAGSTNCKAIENKDEDLVKRMFVGTQYPQITSHGAYDCYYRIAPAGYWFPSSIAMNILGTDSKGQPVDFVREEILRGEVYSACVEAVTTQLGSYFGRGKKKCRKYLDI